MDRIFSGVLHSRPIPEAALALTPTSFLPNRRFKRGDLKRAGRPSSNPATVSEIAYAWGFSDLTLCRRRKKAYGLLPGEYRALVNQPSC
ncbi:MAG: hypothetical protein JWP08_3174 [Bryobacterales bacterium]|nr:hypothetical protein [Bryobacterales bacterium]